jgi:hypothetical protein
MHGTAGSLENLAASRSIEHSRTSVLLDQQAGLKWHRYAGHLNYGVFQLFIPRSTQIAARERRALWRLRCGRRIRFQIRASA